MTISTSRTFEFDVAAIVKLAYQTAGLLSIHQAVNAQQAQHGMDMLDLLVKSTQTMGLFAKTIAFYDLQLLAGVRSYPLAASVLEAQGDGSFIAVGQSLTAASGETPVKMVSREEWQALSAKDADGRPTMYFVDRTASEATVYFWPTPDAANAGTVRLQTHRLRADTREGGVTLEFEPYWQEYFVCALGAKLALTHSKNLGKVKFLEERADEYLERCRAQAQQRGSQQFVVAHMSGGYR